MTAYVLAGLSQAKAAGFDVKQDAMDQGRGWLKHVFAASNTVLVGWARTAVAAELVSRRMSRSRSRRVVLLLDCCYAGAFERGLVARAGRDGDRAAVRRPGPGGDHRVQRDGVRL